MPFCRHGFAPDKFTSAFVLVLAEPERRAARIATTTCDQQVAELLFDVQGPTALDSGASATLHGAIEDHWRYAQAATVASGTIEVQRMLVARDVLGEHR